MAVKVRDPSTVPQDEMISIPPENIARFKEERSE